MQVGTLALLGIVSGILSFYSLRIPMGIGWLIYPGIIFGIILGCHFLITLRPVSFLKIIFFVFFSTLAYYLAVQSIGYTAYVFDAIGFTWEYGDMLLAPLFTAGVIGAAVLLLAVHVFFVKMSLRQWVVLQLLGGLLSFGWFILPRNLLFHDQGTIWGPAEESFLSIYLIWQTGMAIGIGWVLSNLPIKKK